MKEITYSQSGDYLIPNLERTATTENISSGKYGMLRHTYLKTYKRDLYAKLLFSGNHSTEALYLIVRYKGK